MSLPGADNPHDPAAKRSTPSTIAAALPTSTSTAPGAASGPVLPKLEIGWTCPAAVTATAGTATTIAHAYSTLGYAVLICTTPAQRLYYFGLDKTDANRFITLPAAADGTGYTATNGRTRYFISNTRLRVSTGKTTELDEAVIDHLP